MKHIYSGYQKTGALLWILNSQYFIVQLLVAHAWPVQHSYSWLRNTISDLGNTSCGMYGSKYVCSPLHGEMNISFILLGLTTLCGASLYIYRRQLPTYVACGFGCMALTGIGTILVGLFPENSVASLHICGAAVAFLFGNLGMVLMGFGSRSLPKWWRIYAILSGLIGFVALALFLMKLYGSLSEGGMERIVSYPQTIWMIIFGGYTLLAKRAKQQH